MTKTEKKNILLGVTASIAAYKACGLVTELKRLGFSVTVVMTKDAEHFVTPLTLQSLSGKPVVCDLFSVPDRVKPIHIELAKNSDLILIAPATADIIAKLAHGLCDDVLTCAVLSAEVPVVIAPAMNDKMYIHPATQANIKRLESFRVHFIPPIEGLLVCGGEGVGHIADNLTIISAVQKCLSH